MGRTAEICIKQAALAHEHWSCPLPPVHMCHTPHALYPPTPVCLLGTHTAYVGSWMLMMSS